jgi:DNA-binding response OmpR family regulator
LNPVALIIEDDEDMGTIFAAAMRQAGYDPEVVVDGQLALDRLAELTPDIVILDLHLPTVSGPEILKHIRGNERLKETRVIIATADPHLADTLRKDVSFVLDKPVSFKQLSVLSGRLRPSPSD